MHEVPPCTDSYNMQVVACAVNPSGRFIRLGLTATHPHATAVFAFDDKREGVEKMYYEHIMCMFFIIEIFCAVLFALVGELILSFLCVLMIFVSICGLLFL